MMPSGAIPLAKEIDRVPSLTVPLDHAQEQRFQRLMNPKRCRPHRTETNDSYRVDETSITIKKQRYYLYRAVDSASQTMDFLLSTRRGATAVERCFRKALRARHTVIPRVFTVDKNAAYPPAFATLQQEGQLPVSGTLRQCTYFTNVVEQIIVVSHAASIRASGVARSVPHGGLSKAMKPCT